MQTNPILSRLSHMRQPLVDGFFTTGATCVDASIGGGLTRGRLHEVYAAQSDDAASASGFAVMLAKRAEMLGKPLLWARQSKDRRDGRIHAPGWAEMGLDPGQCLFVEASDPLMLLRVGVDAARCNGMGMVVIEACGAFREIDLTVSRRMQLAAEKAGVTILLLRVGTAAQSSAAETRWSVSSAPSRPLDAGAPGAPTFDVELLRQRAGPSGMKWRLEWNYEQSAFFESALSRPLVSVSVGGQGADTAAAPQHRRVA